MSGDYAEELDVDFGTAILSTVQLFNASKFVEPLLIAKAAMQQDHFSTNGTIAIHLKTALQSAGMDLYYLENQIPDQTLAAAVACGGIASAFLEFVGHLWRLDASSSMVILSQMYKYDLSSDQTSVFEDIINFIDDPSFLLAMAGIGASFIPVIGPWAMGTLLTASFAYGIGDLGIKLKNGEISLEEFFLYGTIMVALTAAGGTAIASEGRILTKLLAMSSKELAILFENITVLGLDTATGGVSGGHSSAFEVAIGHLQSTFVNDLGMEPAAAQALIQNLIAQIQANGPIGENPYSVDIPDGVDAGNIPTYDGEPGPAYIPVDGGDEITTSVINQYPDFIAWMNNLEAEYKAQLPAGFDVDPVMFVHFCDGQDHVPENYHTLLMAAFRNVDPRWFIYN